MTCYIIFRAWKLVVNVLVRRNIAYVTHNMYSNVRTQTTIPCMHVCVHWALEERYGNLKIPHSKHLHGWRDEYQAHQQWWDWMSWLWRKSQSTSQPAMFERHEKCKRSAEFPPTPTVLEIYWYPKIIYLWLKQPKLMSFSVAMITILLLSFVPHCHMVCVCVCAKKSVENLSMLR